MGFCTRCGTLIGSADDGTGGICPSCESAGSGIGKAADVPCQRCGMYLPSHELRMYNSRLYCAYCIMDVQDEEKYGKERQRAKEERRPEEKGAIDLQPYGKTGVCEKCGRETATFYSFGGKRLCEQCCNNESGGGAVGGAGFPPVFQAIVERVRGALGMKEAPKIISAPQSQQPTGNNETVFDLKKRRMVEQDHMGKQEPLHEKKREERKASKKSKESFFGLHPGAKKEE